MRLLNRVANRPAELWRILEHSDANELSPKLSYSRVDEEFTGGVRILGQRDQPAPFNTRR